GGGGALPSGGGGGALPSGGGGGALPSGGGGGALPSGGGGGAVVPGDVLIMPNLRSISSISFLPIICKKKLLIFLNNLDVSITLWAYTGPLQSQATLQ
ncbi:MAG: hypothetical protein ACP6IQ_10255, partial [Candidatus Njordarchaeia archaeon]